MVSASARNGVLPEHIKAGAMEVVYTGADALLHVLKQHVGETDLIHIWVGLSADDDSGPFEVGVAIGKDQNQIITLSIDEAKELAASITVIYTGPNGKYLGECLQNAADTAEGMNGVRH